MGGVRQTEQLARGRAAFQHPPTPPPLAPPLEPPTATGWLTPGHKAAVQAFLTYAARYKDVWFVTHAQLIDWMQVRWGCGGGGRSGVAGGWPAHLWRARPNRSPAHSTNTPVPPHPTSSEPRALLQDGQVLGGLPTGGLLPWGHAPAGRRLAPALTPLARPRAPPPSQPHHQQQAPPHTSWSTRFVSKPPNPPHAAHAHAQAQAPPPYSLARCPPLPPHTSHLPHISLPPPAPAPSTPPLALAPRTTRTAASPALASRPPPHTHRLARTTPNPTHPLPCLHSLPSLLSCCPLACSLSACLCFCPPANTPSLLMPPLPSLMLPLQHVASPPPDAPPPPCHTSAARETPPPPPPPRVWLRVVNACTSVAVAEKGGWGASRAQNVQGGPWG